MRSAIRVTVIRCCVCIVIALLSDTICIGTRLSGMGVKVFVLSMLWHGEMCCQYQHVREGLRSCGH